MPFKIVLTFSQFNQGWTESWYHSGPNLQASIALWTDPNVLQILAKWRGKGVVLNAVRAIDTANTRSSLIKTVNYQSSPVTSGGPDLTGATAELQFGSSTGRRRTMSVRGLQDNDITRNSGSGVSQPSAVLTAALNEYIGKIVGVSTDYIRYLTPVGTFPWQNVTALTPVVGNPAQTTVTTAVGLAVLPGDLVYFRGVPLNQLPGLKGNFRVVSVTNGTNFIIAFRLPSGAAVAPVSMQARQALYLYDAIVLGAFRLFTVRKTGRPFTLTRGRSRGVRLRQ